ncbi:hypothetical protein [Nannocystis pusilla]|uniref:hypothetical protein n=1 Tax=Nannocystis pusilla TaxID=889268 RepID=UPI003B7F3ABC
MSGCDEVVQRVAATQAGPTTLRDDAGPMEGNCSDCATRAKFRARPPAGINAPPSL